MEYQRKFRREDWVEGPALVRWLEAHKVRTDEKRIGNTLAKRVRDWRRGAWASVYIVDDLLIRQGGRLSINDLPPELFTATEDPRRYAPPYPAEVRAYALEQARIRPAGEVAAEVGCTVRALDYWRRKAGDEAVA